jgi:1-pyrroline-4-hydroxy-2-carboxylate deaminase
MSSKVNWRGVFPAVTTQFRDDFSVDYEATHKVMSQLVSDGVSGMIVCGTVGENGSLTRDERIGVMEAARAASEGRIPVIAGIAETTSEFACQMALAAHKARMDGIMLMPPLVYSAKPRETSAHYRSVAKATDLPVMVYNNPPIYRTDETPHRRDP